MWVTPKTDWTPQDVYNIAVDLTRVEGNIHEILLIVQAGGYNISLSEKTTWAMTDFLTSTQLTRIVGNLQQLEAVLSVPDGLPDLPAPYDQMAFTDTEANALEKHTLALKQVADGMTNLYIPCGIMQSGTRPLLPI